MPRSNGPDGPGPSARPSPPGTARPGAGGPAGPWPPPPAAPPSAPGGRALLPRAPLSSEELLMLWPDEIWQQDIGALAILDGRGLLDPDGRLRIEAVQEAVGRRLHLVPRFRQLLRVPPERLGGPLWVDDPVFDLGH